MNAAYVLQKALEKRTDERGYVRTSMEELVDLTDLSPRTIQRALTQLVEAGLIRRRSVHGRSGGLLIRLENPSTNPSQTRQKPVKSDGFDHVFNQGAGPFGALSPPGNATENPSPSTSGRGSAYRPTAPHETPLSGADLLFTGPDGNGKWRRISATFWEAPNGDMVSIRSMTPELRMRLRVDENDDGSKNIEAVRAIRGILDR